MSIRNQSDSIFFLRHDGAKYSSTPLVALFRNLDVTSGFASVHRAYSLMEDKRLDLDAPLMSVRRHSVPPAAANPQQRSALPFYKPDLKSGPLRNPGVVPFVWEKKPGHPKGQDPSRHRLPKAPPLPPCRIPNDNEEDEIIREHKSRQHAIPKRQSSQPSPPPPAAAMVSEEFPSMEEDDIFSDAVSGLSGILNVIDPCGSLPNNSKARDFMMDRFLPAAQAMASSTKCAPKKPPKVENGVENGDRRAVRVPLPHQYRPNFVARYPRDVLDEIPSFDGDSDGDGSYDGDTIYSSKACGLLSQLRLKNSICLLNAMRGKKVGRRSHRRPPTGWKLGGVPQNNKHLTQAEDELWEEVYKHKLSLGLHHQVEGGSKSTSESNQYGQLTDSPPTLDESSSCHRSDSRETHVEFQDKDRKNFTSDGSDCFDKDGERYWVRSSSHGILQGSGVSSPTGEKPLQGNSIHIPVEKNIDAKNFGRSGGLLGFPESEPSSTERKMDMNTFNEPNKSVVQEDGDNLMLERPIFAVFQPPESGVTEFDLLLCSNNDRKLEARINAFHDIGRSDNSLLLKEGDQSEKNSDPFRSLLPLPLPKSPSESWLSHALPSASSRVQPGQSILSAQSLQKKQAFYTSFPKQKKFPKLLDSEKPQQCILPLTKPSEEIKKHCILHEKVPDIKPSEPRNPQIRFADVLTTPLSP